MRILIDADGCPVVDIAIGLGKKYAVKCIILCDTAHVFQREGATTVTVSQGADSVDFALVNMIEKNDIAITQDYGLAAMCLAKNAVALSQDGMIYSDDNIDALLFQRHTARAMRMQGSRTRGNPKRRPSQDVAFAECLEQILKKM